MVALDEEIMGQSTNRQWGYSTQMSTYTLTGRITHTQREPLAGLIVRAYNLDRNSPDHFLGETTTDQDGRYTLRFTDEQVEAKKQESGGPDIFIVVFSGDEQVGRSGVRRNAGRRVSISLQVQLPEPAESEEPAFSVSGTVRQSEGRPLTDVMARAFDQGLRERRSILGESKTDRNGRYTIAYQPKQLLNPDRGSANLLVELVSRDGAVLTRSDIQFNARPVEIIDLTVDTDEQASEWEQLMARMRPALQGLSIAELADGELAFIAQSQRLDLKQLKQAAEAARAAEKSQFPEWFHYALTRQRLPTELDALLGTPNARIQQALDTALNSNIIAPDEKELAALQQAFASRQTEHLLDKALPGHRLSARKMFALAGLDKEEQQIMARALVKQGRRGLDGSIGITADSGLDEATVERLRFTLRLARLVDDRESAVQELVQDERIHSLRDLARHFDPDTWEQLLERATTKDGQELPDDLPGETPADRRAAYARQLHARAAAAYPTVAMAYGLARRAALADNRGVQLLPQIVEDDERFDINSARIDQYLADRGEALGLKTKEDVAAATKELKRVQRLHRLRPDMPVVARLLEDKLDSATAIAHQGKRQFVEKYATVPDVGRETALATYHEAERIATRALGVYAHYSPSINTSPLPAAIDDCPVALKGVPNIPTLFGALDGCECEPCESVYSPAAYLTELLAFLERNIEPLPGFDRPDLVAKNGLKALSERSYCNADNQLQTRTRRPDIVETLLSCRNAETEMPYVDIALEVLERAVAPEGADEVHQTTLPADQLAAQPEYLNEKAYETLSRTIFPFSLPFDLWHEEESIYLARLGTSRAELLETFYPFIPTDDLSVFADGKEPHDLREIRSWQDTTIAQARLGMSTNVWKLISAQPIPPAQVTVAAELWGYPSSGGNNWWHPLRNAASLMARGGLDYKDLLRLLRVRSFNPTGSIGIAEESLGACDPKAINVKGLNAGALGFLHRFLRLRHTLGWTLRELDQTLLSLAPPSSINARPALDEEFLVRLSHLVHLQRKFGLPLDELLSWWSKLETRDYRVPQLSHEKASPSLYERLFLSGRAGEAGFEAFKLNTGRTEVMGNNQLLNNHQPPVAGALRLTLPDLHLLMDGLKAALVQNTQGDPRLILANLSMLFRHASMARALGLKIQEYVTLRALIPFDPFLTTELATNDPLSGTVQTLRFVERVEAVRESGFSIAELDYLLRQTMPFADQTVAPTEGWVSESLNHIKQNLLSLPIAVAPIALLNEVLALLDADAPSDIVLDDVRHLIEEALSAFDTTGDGQSPPFIETRQLLRDAQQLVSSDAAFTDAMQIELRGKISESLGYYEQILHELRAESLQRALAEILSLPVAVSRILLEHTPLPADPTQLAGEVFISDWLSPPAEAEASDAANDEASVSGADSADGNGGNGSGAGTTPEVSQQTQTVLLYRLHKAAMVISRLGIRAHELVSNAGRARYLNMSESTGWLDVTRLPVLSDELTVSFDAWMRTVRLFHFRDVLPAAQQDHLFELFDSAAEYQPGVTPYAGKQRRDFIDKLATLSSWQADDLRALVGQFDIGEISHGGGGMLQAAFPQQFADERLPRRILSATQLLKRLGVSAFDAEGWIASPPGAMHPVVRAQNIKNALKARYGDGWGDILKPLRDPLRERQRQALVTCLLHLWRLERADNLFDHFLIDAEMSPCMISSRLIQAIASVQLFVQRVLMNLEPGLALSAEGAEQWEWMKNYRVWEANRKVFLYPENWIEPELRDDKTPFFKDLENELMQADITNDTAETALLHYLEKLHEVSRLQICGQYMEANYSDYSGTLHVFARTRDVPHHYYYRRGHMESGSNFVNWWTPWERVEVDIEGDQLIPLVYNRRVYLFWPIYTSEDEAPMTHLTQQVMKISGDVFKLQSKFQKAISDFVPVAIQGLGTAVIAGTTNTIIQMLFAIDKAVNVFPTLPDINPNFGPIRDKVRDIRRDLLLLLGVDTSDYDPPKLKPNGDSWKDYYDKTGNIVGKLDLIDLNDFGDILKDADELVKSFETEWIKLLPAKRLDIQIAWSEFKGDSWAAKKTSASVVTFRDVVSAFFESLPELPGLGSTGVKRLFTFRGDVDHDYNRLFIHCNVALPKSLFDPEKPNQDDSASPGDTAWLSVPKEIGYFRLNGCNGTLEAEDTPDNINLIDLFSQGISQAVGIAGDLADTLGKDRQLTQRGAPITPDDDPKRPSKLRAWLDTGSYQQPTPYLERIPRHYFPPYPVTTNSGLITANNSEDIYRILARHQDAAEATKLEGFFYQDSRRTYLCKPVEVSPGKPDTYIFFPYYHPYTCALLENLQRAGVGGIYQDRYMRMGEQLRLPYPGETGEPLQIVLQDEEFFKREYYPRNYYSSDNEESAKHPLRPVEEFNFSNIGAYAQYNWEIFFHIPLLIANRLSINQKFREAQHWFHCIFNPTDASHGSVPEKYWRTKPFVEQPKAKYTAQDIDALLLQLNSEAEISGLQEIEWAVRRWRRDAFNPHLIARTRTVAFQKTVVMKYIDNLIAWADSLFRRETRESLNEAMQLYILAAKLLGPRPRRLPKSLERSDKSFHDLQENLDDFSNALVDFENYLTPTSTALNAPSYWNHGLVVEENKSQLAGATLSPAGNAHRELLRSPSLRDATRPPGEAGLYFCVPPNEQLLGKWDVVADRLFKIRHCQDIEGQALSLALLSPPIDPSLLVRARVLGMDVDSVLSTLQAPLPHYRFQPLVQKASELCGEVKALGSALISALEKRDGEELSLLRTTHELHLLNAVQTLKEQQIKEANCSLEGLQHSKEATEIRRDHNVRLLMEFISPEEVAGSVLGAASLLMQVAQVGAKFGSVAGGLVPNIKGGFVTTLGAMFGGQQIGDSAERAADAFGHIGSILSSTSGLISTMGGYRRRADDWLLQISLAEKELEGFEKQICAAEIRVAAAQADLENHKLQIRNSQETQEFMQQKFTNQELYDWMVAQTSSLYFQSYQLAYDMARKAQQTLAFELGEENPGIIRYGYWDSLKKGLLSGEHLYHDLKRLEVAYLDRNRREYELTKHVSLSTLAPLELIRLRETGKADFALPEALFDMDFPGHFMRRIKSIRMSIPCVTGPYTGVSATLRLQKSRIRWQPGLNPDYLSYDADDPRFTSLYTATRAIATSTGQNDSGLFELNLRDERFLPFEGEGVESMWELTINKEFAQFDLNTISEVVLHILYSARDGGEQLRVAALESLENLKTAMSTLEGEPLPLTRLFSVRHEFPTAWARFKSQTPQSGQRFALTLQLRPEHYPFWSQNRGKTVTGVNVLAASELAVPEAIGIAITPGEASANIALLTIDSGGGLGGLLIGSFESTALPAPEGELNLFLDTSSLANLWIGLTWEAA